MDTLAARMRWALDQKPGSSQAELARACKVKPPSVADWLSGKTKTLKAESLRSAAAYLGVNRDWLESGLGAAFSAQEPSAVYYQAQTNTVELTTCDLVVQLGQTIAGLDPVTRAAVPGLLARLADHPDEAKDIGHRLQILMDAASR